MNIEKAVSECLADLSLAHNTEMTYKKGIKKFIEYVGKKGVSASEDVGVLNIEYFITFPAWLDKVYAKQTCGVYTAAARAFFDYLIISKSIPEPSHYDILRYKKATTRSHKRHEDRLPRFPNRTDVPKMLETARILCEESPRKERNIALLEFLASSGCRISEATALNVQDINLVDRSTIVTGKGSKERRVWFSQAAGDAMVEYWKVRDSSMATDPVFGRHDKGAGTKRIKRITTTTARNIVNLVATVAGIDPTKFSPHYFRHAFAIRVLSETGNLALAQDLLGHVSPQSTRVYAKIYSDDMQAAHRKIFE
jgi:site-specific recombinase XerD